MKPYLPFRRPFISFLFYFILITIIALASNKSEIMSLFLFLFPWLALIFFFLNMPFIRAAFQQFRMHESKKMNHVLEHGTVYFLKERYGKYSGVGGSADYDGFRVSGVKKKKHIYEAFNKLVEYIFKEKRWEHLMTSKLCGSNIVTAQGFGIILLTVTGFVLIFLKLKNFVSFIVLGLNIIIYFLLRYPLGNFVQKKLFLSFNFENAKIVGIKRVKKGLFEEGGVYFVETKILKNKKAQCSEVRK